MGPDGVNEIACVVVTAILTCIFLAHFLDGRWFRWFPPSSIFVFVGVVCGILFHFGASKKTQRDLVTFNPKIFFSFLLPPIIFQAGLSLMKKCFFRNLGPIILLAMIGTVISTVVVYACMQGFAHELGGLNNAMFAVLISAVDPVAVLSLFEKYSSNCDKVAYVLIFGESLLNDAVCVVLFDSLKAFREHRPIMQNVGMFFYLSIVSPLVGVVFGAASALIFKHVKQLTHHTNAVEVAIVMLFGAYLPYLLAELAGLSAIVTIFVAGIMTNHYTLRNLSEEAATAIVSFSSTISVLAETMVFLYMGIGVFGSEDLDWDPKLIVKVILACLAGRAANSFLLLPLVNLFRNNRDSPKISFKQMIAVWFAGLRGAIAFALSTELAEVSKNRKFVSTTLGIVLFTTFILGGLADYLYTFLGMIGIENMDDLHTPATPPTATQERSTVHRGWKNLDTNFLKKWLCVQTNEAEDLAFREHISKHLSTAFYNVGGNATPRIPLPPLPESTPNIRARLLTNQAVL